MSAFDLSGSNYSEVDASNNNATPGGMPEGMAPSGVNDAGRSLMAAVKRAYDWDHAGTWATVGGTANAITLTYPVAPAAYVQGQKHSFKATAANTSTATVNINSLGAKNVFKKTGSGVAACAGGEIQVGDLVELEYDGTQFQIMGGATFAGGTLSTALNEAPIATLASAATTDIGSAASNWIQITGTTTITSLGAVINGARRTVYFGGVLTLTNSGTLILPGAANITTASGDTATFIGSAGAWICVSYTRVSGQAVVSAFSKKFTGAQTAIVAAAASTFAHSLGAAPFNFDLYLVCQTGELGYTAGQIARVDIVPNASVSRGIAIAADATNIYVTIGSDSVPLQIINLSTGAIASITLASWKYVAIGWL